MLQESAALCATQSIAQIWTENGRHFTGEQFHAWLSRRPHGLSIEAIRHTRICTAIHIGEFSWIRIA